MKYYVSVSDINNPNILIAKLVGQDKHSKPEIRLNRKKYNDNILHDLFHLGRCKLDSCSFEEYNSYLLSLNIELRMDDESQNDLTEEIEVIDKEIKAEEKLFSTSEEILTNEDKKNLTGLKRLGIIANSKAMAEVYDKIQTFKNEITVFITGETGTGKELIAKAIHKVSNRSTKKYATINCGAFPDTLLQSELFGHSAGAFTDAKSKRLGLFSKADGGTLFLDEIGELSPAAQANMLRVLQEGEIKPLGSDTSEKVDVRIIAATLKDLKDNPDFRNDLYYRIDKGRIHLPPLRDRKNDIPVLASFFYERYAKKYHDTHGVELFEVAPEKFNVLKEYDWPGNIRELENKIEKFVLFNHQAVSDIPLNKLKEIILNESTYRTDTQKPSISDIDFERMKLYIKNNYNLSATKKDIQFHPRAAEFKSRDTQLIKQKINNFLLMLGKEHNYDKFNIVDQLVDVIDLTPINKPDLLNKVGEHFHQILNEHDPPKKLMYDPDLDALADSLRNSQ